MPLFSKEDHKKIRRQLSMMGISVLPRPRIPPTAQEVKKKARGLATLCRRVRKRRE